MSEIRRSTARPLVWGDVSLPAPSGKRDGTNPDPGDSETGFLQLAFSLLGAVEPCVVSRWKHLRVAEQLQQSWIVATVIPRQRSDRR